MRFRWRIRQKLGAGLLLVVGMTTLLSGGAFYGLYSYRHSNKTFDYHHKQLERLEILTLAIFEITMPLPSAQDAEPNPEPSHKPKLARLDRAENTLAAYRKSLAEGVAAKLISDRVADQVECMDAMKRLVGELRQSLTGGGRAAASTDSPRSNRSWWANESEWTACSDLITTLQRLRGHIDLKIRDNVEADRNNYRTAMAIVYSTSVLVLAMLGLLVWLGYEAFFDPIRALHRGVTKLAHGNFDSRVELDSGDEMQELGEAFNEMADRLQATYRDLNRQVEERSRQLIRTERLASVGFLAAGVAHEINNPLASIAFCGEALESRVKQFLPEQNHETDVIRNYLNMIQQEAFRCKAITEKLLNFSRVGAPERIEADLAALVREVVEMVQHLGRARGKTLSFQPTETVFCRVNPQELKQVLLNLVVNGLESVEDGGEVVVQTRNVGQNVEVSVRDNGCGMTPDVLENLFEPFFTRNRTGKGTGLGLSISHLIVSQHGGTLEAASDGPDRGSTFTVRLPLHAAARAAA